LLLNRQRLNRRKLPLSRLIIIEDLNLQKKFHTVDAGNTSSTAAKEIAIQILNDNK